MTLNSSGVNNNIAGVTGGGVELFNGPSLVTNGASTINGNDAASQGGGIDVQLGAGSITLNQGSAVNGNDAGALGGGIAHTSGAANASVNLNGATIVGNDVLPAVMGGISSGGGIHFVGIDPTQSLNINAAQVSQNTVGGEESQGGGINANMVNPSSDVTITGSSVSSNTVTITNDADAPSFEGGGGLMLAGPGASLIQRSTFDGNVVSVGDGEDVATGGGIFDQGVLGIETSTISNNNVSGGADGNVNTSPRGAGLSAATPAGGVQVANSTFSGNTAVSGTQPSTAGAILGTASSQLLIAHATFGGNSAGTADALALSGAFNAANFTLRGSVIDEGALACVPQGFSEDPNGFNVDAGTSCVGTNVDTDVRTATIGLGPLANNGGPTQTMSLSPTSPAVDLVPTAADNCDGALPGDLTTDQRGTGFPRPFPAAGNCDAGAYELQDLDGDGLRDTGDGCPTQVGPASNGGCPLAAVTPITPVTPAPASSTPAPATTKKKCKKRRRSARSPSKEVQAEEEVASRAR